MRLQARTLTLLAAAGGVSLTLAVILVPAVRFAYRNPRLHIAIDTADAVIALLVAFLLFGRFRRSRLLRDFLLVHALLLFGFGNLFLSALPTTLSGVRLDDLSTWGTLFTRTMGGAFMTGAAFAGARAAPRLGRQGLSVIALSLGIVLVVWVAVALLEPTLPPAVATVEPLDTGSRKLDGHPGVVILHVVLIAMFAITALRVTTQAQSEQDELMRWFGAGAALGAFARFNYLIYPSLYSNYVYLGDMFRLGFYLMLLVGAGREIASYWRRLAESAVTDERRRMARDLHDGLAQELAFMWNDMQILRRAQPDNEKVNRAAVSAERALDESRRAIAAFTRAPDEPLDTALSSYIEEVARRLQVRVRLDLEPDIEIETKVREDLLRVAREAVTNAARHGRAETIVIRLWRDGDLHLSVSDDGLGFDATQPQKPGSFGIISMRERVGNHEGRLQITSRPGEGTEVEVRLP